VFGSLPLGRAYGSGMVVPPVDRGGELIEINRDPVRFPLAGGPGHDLGKEGQLLEQLGILGSW
jgi:hypothetical protein